MKTKILEKKVSAHPDQSDFSKFIKNLLNENILNGLEYPLLLIGNPKTFTAGRRAEWISYTINRIFERCAERFKEVSRRDISSVEAYILVKEVAGFVEKNNKQDLSLNKLP